MDPGESAEEWIPASFGMAVEGSLPAGATSKPIGSRQARISPAVSSVPRMALTRPVRTRTVGRGGRFPCACTSPGAGVTPPGAANSAKRSSAHGAISGSTPASKRAEASLRNPRRREVRAMSGGFHQAASSSTTSVPAEISVEAPPMTPAMPMGRSEASTITPSPAWSVRTTPSRVSTCSPSAARRTPSAPPGTRSASKAWEGWPISSIT